MFVPGNSFQTIALQRSSLLGPILKLGRKWSHLIKLRKLLSFSTIIDLAATNTLAYLSVSIEDEKLYKIGTLSVE